MKAIYIPFYILMFLQLSSPAGAATDTVDIHWSGKRCDHTCTRWHCKKSQDNWNECYENCHTTEGITNIPKCVKAALKAGYITKTQCKYLQKIPMYEDLACEIK